MQYHFTKRERRKGAWQLILSYKGTDGKWHQLTKSGFPLKKFITETDEKELLAKVSMSAACPVSFANITFGEFARYYVDSLEVSYNTRISYLNGLHYLLPLAPTKVTDITYLQLVEYVKTLQASYTVSTVQYIVRLLKSIMSAAVDYEILAYSPTLRLKVAAPKEDIPLKVFTEAEFHALLERTEKFPVVHAMTAIAGYTGLRCGEILGLTWSDVDFTNKTIRVNKQWKRLSDAGNTNGKRRRYNFGFGSLKTKNSYRTVPIPDALIAILEKYYDYLDMMDQFKVVSFTNHQEAYRLFSLDRCFAVPFYWRDPQKRTIHCLRHTYATRLISAGVDIVTIAALLGDTVSVVIKTYVHYSEDMREKAAQDVQRIFG